MTTENQPENTQPEVTAELSMAELQQQLLDLKTQMSKDVNGVAKKLQAEISSLKTSSSTEEKQQITVEALQAQYDKKLEEIQANYTSEIEGMRSQQAEKELKVFQSTAKSTIIEKIAGQGFDDNTAAAKIFLLEHPINNFIEGSDGILVFKNNPNNRGEKGKTLETLVGEWKNSAVGKRFLPGQNNRTDPQGSQPEKKVSKTEEILNKIKSGELEFKAGYY